MLFLFPPQTLYPKSEIQLFRFSCVWVKSKFDAHHHLSKWPVKRKILWTAKAQVAKPQQLIKREPVKHTCKKCNKCRRKSYWKVMEFGFENCVRTLNFVFLGLMVDCGIFWQLLMESCLFGATYSVAGCFLHRLFWRKFGAIWQFTYLGLGLWVRVSKKYRILAPKRSATKLLCRKVVYPLLIVLDWLAVALLILLAYPPSQLL